MSLLILPARTPGNRVAQRLDHYDGLTSCGLSAIALKATIRTPRRRTRTRSDGTVTVVASIERLERFVLRARRVMAHSLIRDHMDLLQELADGTFKVKVMKNPEPGDREQRLLLELPPEEAFESFAARLRPFTIRDEPVYWELVLDAVADLTPQEIRDEVIDLEGLRAAYDDATQGKNTAQAYSVITENGQLTDLQLADLWMYSDALHAQVITSAVGKDLGLDERYQAAAGVYARLGAAVNATYNMIAHLVREGLLDLDKAVFTERMLAETSIDMPMVGGYSAPVGSAPMPSDMSDTSELDPKVWRPIWEEFEEIIEARKKEKAADRCPQCRGTGGVQIRWPNTTFDS